MGLALALAFVPVLWLETSALAAPEVSATSVTPSVVSKVGSATIAPTTTAWFDTSRLSASAPSTTPAGVTATQLVVEGITISEPVTLGSSMSLPATRLVTAFSALTYVVPHDTSATTLSLAMSAGGGQSSSVAKDPAMACLATSTFAAGADQPGAAAPKYDCAKGSVIGEYNASAHAITFSDIGTLARGSALSFVVLPNGLGIDHLILKAPGDGSLTVKRVGSGGLTSTASSTPHPSPASSPGSGPVATPSPSPSSTAVAGTFPTPSPGSTLTTFPSPSSSTSAAAIAPTPSAGGPSTTLIETTSASRPFDNRTERIAALVMLGVLCGVTALLIFSDRGAQLREAEGGLGRFRATRVGLPPPL
jgi:hypothetical protein